MQVLFIFGSIANTIRVVEKHKTGEYVFWYSNTNFWLHPFATNLA